MPEVPSSDAGNDEGLVNSHRFVGSNTALPAFHGYSAQLDEVVRFLREDKLRVDIFALLLPAQGTATAPDSAGSSGAPRVPQPVLVAPADAFDVAVRGGVEIGIEVVVRTANVGHTFTGGTSDSNMAWLEVTVLDADGQPVLMSGGMDEQTLCRPRITFLPRAVSRRGRPGSVEAQRVGPPDSGVRARDSAAPVTRFTLGSKYPTATSAAHYRCVHDSTTASTSSRTTAGCSVRSRGPSSRRAQ